MRPALRFMLVHMAAGALSWLGSELASKIKGLLTDSKSPELEAIEALEREVEEVRGLLEKMERERRGEG